MTWKRPHIWSEQPMFANYWARGLLKETCSNRTLRYKNKFNFRMSHLQYLHHVGISQTAALIMFSLVSFPIHSSSEKCCIKRYSFTEDCWMGTSPLQASTCQEEGHFSKKTALSAPSLTHEWWIWWKEMGKHTASFNIWCL